MAKDVRNKMIDGAVRLLATRGLDATSFPEVLAATGASRGSVYHHFPGGKDELVRAALDVAGDALLTALDRLDGQRADVVADAFVDLWRGILVRSAFDAGCAVVAVTVAADTPALLGRVAAVFRGWRARLADVLERGGLSPADAARFATVLIAACEGAVALARAERSLEPFEPVARTLHDEAARLLAKRASRRRMAAG